MSENKLRPDDTVDDIWEFLHNLVMMLHVEGMSSDESNGEGGHTKYWVKTRQWCSKALNQYLQRTDLNANQMNVFGKPWPGNPPQSRKR